MNEKDVADKLEAYLLKARNGGRPEGPEAEALAPLLEAAERVRRLRSYRLPESRRQRAKARLQAAWIAQESAKSSASGWGKWLVWPGVRGHLRGITAAVLALILVTTLTFTALASTDPGSIVYPARVALERVPALLQSQPEARAGAELRAADRRLADLSSHLERTGQPAQAAVEALLKGDAAAAATAASLDGAGQRAVAARIAAHAAELARLAELTTDIESKAALRSAAITAEQLVNSLVGPSPVLTAPVTVTPAPTATEAPTSRPSPIPPSPSAAAPADTVQRPTDRPLPATSEATRPLPTFTPDQRPVIGPGLRATARAITPSATATEGRPTATGTLQPQHPVVPGARATALATITAQPTSHGPSTTAPAGPRPGMRATALALTATPPPAPTATPLPVLTPTPTAVVATPTPTAEETVPPSAHTPIPGRRATAMAQGNSPTPAAAEPTATPTLEATP